MELWRHPASLCIILRADISSHRCRLVTPAVTRFSQLRSQLQLLTEPWAGYGWITQPFETVLRPCFHIMDHHGAHSDIKIFSFDHSQTLRTCMYNYVHVYKCPVSWTVPTSPGGHGATGLILATKQRMCISHLRGLQECCCSLRGLKSMRLSCEPLLHHPSSQEL